ncbi:cytochrome P450 78A3-like [Wolffia australiana]
MGVVGEENWWILPLSLAAKCAASQTSLALLGLLFLLTWLFCTLLHWSFPGGPAWGKLLVRRGQSKAIPGPRGLPVVGSLSLLRGLAHRRLAAAADRIGARRLMAVSLGETRLVVTADPDVAKEILNSAAFADRPVKESAYGLMFHRAIGFAPYGAYWRMLRRISSAHLFCPRQIAAAAYRRESIAREMAAALRPRGRESAGAIAIRGVLKRAALNNIMGSVFGRRYGLASSEEDGARELLFLVEEGYDLLGQLCYSDHLPLLAPFDLQGIRRRCTRLVPRVNRFVGEIIDEHRRSGRASRGEDFVDVLLSLQGGADGLSDAEMIAVLWEMVFRGTDTVAVVIEWTLARLVLHREVQEKVHAELDRVVGRSRPVREADVSALPYLGAVIKEAIRLHPPGPLLSWARLATSDADVGGWVVPAGTTTMVNMWAIARDPRLWPEPEEFRPERFGAGGGAAEFGSLFGSDLRLAPFGSGRRSCPGKALGMATVGFWLAALLHEFEWLPRSTEEGAEAGVDLSEVLRLSCEMAVPLSVNLRRRRD